MKDRYKTPIMPLGYMDFSLYAHIIDQLGTDVEIDLHKDGEPLMHPEIGRFIEYAKSKGLFVHLVTNGKLLAKKKEEIVNSGLDLLTVSIVDDIPYDEVTEFYNYKWTGTPETQLKVYENIINPLPMTDGILKRPIHNWTDDQKRITQQPCSKLLNYGAVNWDGGWDICCVDYRRDLVPFNVKDVPIEKCLEFNKMVYKWQQEGLFIPPCNQCNYWRD